MKSKDGFFLEMILTWGRANFADFPWRYTNNSWHALVAEIMLQRTNAPQVVPAFESFCLKYPSVEDFLLDENPNIFGTLGLKWREPMLRQLAEKLVSSSIPHQKKELLLLPGVGEYIASAYRSFHLGERDYIIDSNVVRLYGRYFGFDTHAETRRKKWFKSFANELTPNEYFRDYNYAILDFTRNICKPVPLCGKCPLNSKCIYYQEQKK